MCFILFVRLKIKPDNTFVKKVVHLFVTLMLLPLLPLLLQLRLGGKYVTVCLCTFHNEFKFKCEFVVDFFSIHAK